MMPNNSMLVKPSIVAVPNGFNSNGDLQVSLQITPTKVDPAEILEIQRKGTNTLVDISEWPQRIADLAKSIQIEVASIVDYKKLDSSVVVIPPDVSKVDFVFNSTQLRKAQKLWRDCFPGDSFSWLISVAEADSDEDIKTLVSSPEINSAFLANEIFALNNETLRSELNQLGVSEATSFSAETLHDSLAKWVIPGSARDPLGKLEDRQRMQERFNKMQEVANKYANMLVPSTSQKDMNLKSKIINEAFENVVTPAMLRAMDQADRLSGRGSINSPRKNITSEIFATNDQNQLSDWLESMMLAIAQPDPVELAQRAKANFDQDTDKKEAAQRRLAAILSFPSLAKFLGLAIDIKISRENWNKFVGEREYGAIRASFDRHPPAGASWSAFVKKQKLFHPCDIAEALPINKIPHELRYGPEIIDGVVNLNIKEDSKARYSLMSVDVVNTAFRIHEHARDQLERMRRGDQENKPLPEIAGRGIVLNDLGRFNALVREKIRNEDLAILQPGEERILFAGDLIRGYNVAVALVPLSEKDNLQTEASRWRSIMARHVKYDDDQVDQGFIRAIADAYRERDFAHVRPLDGHDGAGKHLWSQELFGWHGDSLGLPAQGAPAAELDHLHDLNVSMTFSEVEGFKLPPLRDSCAYVFGLVPSYINGCSLSFAQAVAAHSQNLHGHVLGADDGKTAFIFRRCERTPPPVLLLPPDEPLVTRRDTADLPGEAIDVMVIRSGDRSTKRARRFLFPERIAFDRAEQQDQFRHDRDKIPPGAFRSIGAHLSKEGEFPLAYSGGFGFPKKESEQDPEKDPNKDESTKSRGPVMSLRSKPVSLNHEYYCDRYSQTVRGHLMPVIPSNSTFKPANEARSFWKEHPRNALPVMLEIKRGARPTIGERHAQFDLQDTKISVNPSGGGANIRLPKLTVELAPATEVELNLVCETDTKILAATHLYGNFLLSIAKAALEKEGSVVDINPETKAAIILSNALSLGQVTPMQGGRKLRLIHAVQRPLDEPKWDIPEYLGAGLNLRAVWATTLPQNTSLDKNGNPTILPTPNQSSNNEEGGMRCYFVGAFQVDAPSTGSVRCEAQWRDHGPHALRFNVNLKKWFYEPKPLTEQLFSITGLSSATSDHMIKLQGPEDLEKSRSHAFGDGRARRLALRFIGTSRFQSYFPKSIKSTSDDLSPFESASLPFNQAKTIWVPCNFQPPPPTIRRITPVFDYDIQAKHRKLITFKRTTRLRLELGEDCFITGEDERIALCFHEANACDLLKGKLAPHATGITRWGSDPLHNSPVPPTLLGPDRFQRNIQLNCKETIGSGGDYPPDIDPNPGTLKMPVGTDSKLQPLDVSIVDHAVKFDPWNGFYCDITPQPPQFDDDAFMPFIHLGLARYQRHAISGLELSPPVGRDVQLIPPRKGSLMFNGSREFTLNVSGHRNYGGTVPSVLDIRLLQRDKDRDQWRPALDQNHLPIEKLNHPVEESHDKRHFWRWSGVSPHSRRNVNYGLLIEEFEQFFDAARNVERRRLVFSITVDFNQKST